MNRHDRQKRVVRRFAASTLGLAATLAVAAASPALALDADGKFIIDRDNVRIGAQNAASFGEGALDHGVYQDPGTMTWYHDPETGRVRAELTGRAFVAAYGCGHAKVTFTYGDGSTSTATSSTTCDNASVAVDIDSLPSRDAIKATVVIRAGGMTADDSTYGTWGTAYPKVEDGTRSDGTCSQLDLDGVTAANASATLFSGSAKYFCAGDILRVRLRGTLYWDDTMAGDQARLRIRWLLPNNTLSAATLSGLVSQSTPSRAIDVTSPFSTEVLGVCVTVESAPAGSTTFSSQGGACELLGHYGFPTISRAPTVQYTALPQ